MKTEAVKELADTALKELHASLAAGKSERLERLLDFFSKFHDYSWGNCMLIATQFPDATYVAGFRKWLALGRHVRKGETGIGIIAPMAFRKEDAEGDSRELRGFRAVHVFDVSQTEGDELPTHATIQGEPAEMLGRLEAVVQGSGIKLAYEPIPSGAQGVSRLGEIVIASGLDEPERFAVLVHELAHERLHDLQRRKETTKTVRETEAEAVAYVVCRAVGLDPSTRSADYIQLYDGTAETLAGSLEAIQKTARQIIGELMATDSAAVATA